MPAQVDIDFLSQLINWSTNLNSLEETALILKG